MSTYSETGHFKNVSNFENLISYCSAYGKNYNPAQAKIQVPALQQAYSTASIVIENLMAKQTAYKNATNARSIVFEPLKMLSTRIVNAFIACGANQQNTDDVKYYVSKIRGGAKKNVKATITTEPNTAVEVKQHSNIQQSYDNMLEHYSNLITLLGAEPLYQPNEVELSVAGLQTLLSDLKAKNTAVISAQTALSNARLERDETLYATTYNLVEVALDVKKYVKSVYGATSGQYKQVSGIKFTRK